MTARDKLLALRAEAPKTEDAPAEPHRAPRFPERHCSGCGKAGTEDNPLIESDGYLRHRTCPSAVVCWHCGGAVYRPRRLAWGKDIIPLHNHCCGPWVDAWDALLQKEENNDK